MTRGGWHGVAVDQDCGAKIPVQPAEQAAQGAVIRLVKALDSPQRVINRYPLIVDLLGIAERATVPRPPATRIDALANDGSRPSNMRLAVACGYADKATRKRRGIRSETGRHEFIDEVVFRAPQGGAISSRQAVKLRRVELWENSTDWALTRLAENFERGSPSRMLMKCRP